MPFFSRLLLPSTVKDGIEVSSAILAAVPACAGVSRPKSWKSRSRTRAVQTKTLELGIYLDFQAAQDDVPSPQAKGAYHVLYALYCLLHTMYIHV